MNYKLSIAQKVIAKLLQNYCKSFFGWIVVKLLHQLNTVIHTFTHLAHFALKSYKKRAPFGRSTCGYSMEARPGFEPGIKALQASALPLGYGAGKRMGTM